MAAGKWFRRSGAIVETSAGSDTDTAVDRERGLALERHAVVEHYFSGDAREGLAAFAADRDPEF